MDPFGPDFVIGLFDPWGAVPARKFKASHFLSLLTKFIINIAMAPWTVAKVAARLHGSSKTWAYAIPPVFFFFLFLLFHVLDLAWSGCWAIAWFFYLCFATYLTSVRIQTRDKMNIIGKCQTQGPIKARCLGLFTN